MTKSTITRERVVALIAEHSYDSALVDALEHLLAAMDSEAKEPISFDEWSRKCALQITLCYPDFREKAQYIWDSARETQHVVPVAPVVPEILDYQGAKELYNYLMTEEEINATVNAWNACRAAMLAATPQEVK